MSRLIQFTAFNLNFTWREKGGNHAKLIEYAPLNKNKLRILADLTQQLYLGMPSYQDWIVSKWQKKSKQVKNVKIVTKADSN